MTETAVKAGMLMAMGMLALWALGTATPIRALTEMHRAAILPERPENLEGQIKRKTTRRRRGA